MHQDASWRGAGEGSSAPLVAFALPPCVWLSSTGFWAGQGSAPALSLGHRVTLGPQYHLPVWAGPRQCPAQPGVPVPAQPISIFFQMGRRWLAGFFYSLCQQHGTAATAPSACGQHGGAGSASWHHGPKPPQRAGTGLPNSLFVPEPQVGVPDERGSVSAPCLGPALPSAGDGVCGKDFGGGLSGFGGGSCLPPLPSGRSPASSPCLHWYLLTRSSE